MHEKDKIRFWLKYNIIYVKYFEDPIKLVFNYYSIVRNISINTLYLPCQYIEVLSLSNCQNIIVKLRSSVKISLISNEGM